MAIRSPSALEALFWGRVPVAFVQQMLLTLVASVRAADAKCSDLRPTVRRDTFGHVRRACFESQLFDMAAGFAGARALEVPNEPGTASHVRVQFGEVAITQHAVPSRAELPRGADFRETMARSAQTEWPWLGRPQPPPDALMYAMFLYESAVSGRPQFAQFVIPDQTCKKVVRRIDVTHLLNAIYDPAAAAAAAAFVRPAAVIPEEQIVDATVIVLRPDVATRYEEDMTKASPSPTEVVRDTVQLSLFEWADTKDKPANDAK